MVSICGLTPDRIEVFDSVVKLRVLIVDDAVVVRRMVSDMINADLSLEVRRVRRGRADTQTRWSARCS
jgi:hypothetical protein